MKKICLTLLIFLATGCTANYNLEVDKDSLKENIVIEIPSNVVSEETIKSQINDPMLVYPGQQKHYNVEIQNTNKNNYIKYNYEHKIEDFNSSKFLNLCYSENENVFTEEKIVISTGKQFNCIKMDDGVSLDSVKVNITSNLKVTKNNADEINGNVYTWKVNQSNYSNKPIYFEAQLPKSIKAELEKVPNKELIVIIGVITLVLIVTVIVVKFQRRLNNKL